MNRYESSTDDAAARSRTKRFKLALFLPLGGMIIVGLVSLILGFLFHAPPERPDEPLNLPSVEDYERAYQETRARETTGRDAGSAQPDADPGD